jgi:hypothetical protein
MNTPNYALLAQEIREALDRLPHSADDSEKDWFIERVAELLEEYAVPRALFPGQLSFDDIPF